MNSLTLDHVILVVSDLQVATQQFGQLGFTVIPGGVHSGGLTHNALVPFPDGSYLELLSTTRSARIKFLFILKRLRLLSLYIGDDTVINRRLTTQGTWRKKSAFSKRAVNIFQIRIQAVACALMVKRSPGLPPFPVRSTCLS